MDCKYCKNKFTNISSLNKHIKYAKYCKNKRNEKEEILFICEGCDENFTSNYNLTKHIQTCIISIEKKSINISRFFFFIFLYLEIFLDFISIESISRNKSNLTTQN